MKIAIVGRQKDTGNYERFVSSAGVHPLVTLNAGELASCAALILPGGGDITPAFFGEHNNGSVHIDTELDILQLQAFDYALRRKMPILGICKGMQIINVALGGTIIQDLPTSRNHRHQNNDQYHSTRIRPNSCLHKLYGTEAVVNSAHHQGLGRLGRGLFPIQWCPSDNCIEAICHESLPILGVQWHPERLDSRYTQIAGKPILHLLLSQIYAFPRDSQSPDCV